MAGCALAGGVLLDYIAGGVDFGMVSRPGWMLPSAVKYVSAIVLLAVLAFAVPKKMRAADGDKAGTKV